MSFDEGLVVGLALAKKKFGGGGGGDKWTYPADWIQMPNPASNEVYCIGTTSLDTNKTVFVYFESFSTNSPDYVGTINWGDGVTDTITSTTMQHTYTDGTGHLTNSGMEQFLIKVTMEIPPNFGEVSVYVSSGKFALAISYGANTINPNDMSSYGGKTLHQLQLPNTTVLPRMSGMYALKKVITPTKITTVQQIGQCNSLETIDLSEATSVNIYDCYRLAKIDLPKCTTAYISNCFALREINAPLLASVYSYGLSGNYSLSKITYAEGCTFGTNAFLGDYNLYPIPT